MLQTEHGPSGFDFVHKVEMGQDRREGEELWVAINHHKEARAIRVSFAGVHTRMRLRVECFIAVHSKRSRKFFAVLEKDLFELC
jgi:hypothetical protein